ncbi:MAG: bifunctional hydroxymethylpyrimidine kinase/phosphomethylpyrimidine kinase [Oscillospiraceae bacterium]|nr:bifunctional hydroxymethylpyrimidine kinase/phosphomethylpyrimidine kinase [Oscillospiraceae bacterium]
MSRVLLIGDMVSACRVALSAMAPVLTAKGHQVSLLPTAIVSNTFGYKKVAQVSTGDYVKKSLDAWEELDFEFDAVYVGYVTEKEQAAAVIEWCRKRKEKGVLIFHDPIMGEDGHLYYGMNEEIAGFHKEILVLADYTTPSFTEAAFLTGRDYTIEDVQGADLFGAVSDMGGMCHGSIVLTSCLSEGQWCCTCYDSTAGLKFIIPYDFIDKKVGGTGDVFSAVFMGDVLNGMEFMPAVQHAMDTVRHLIELSVGDTDALRGVQLEKYRNLL